MKFRFQTVWLLLIFAISATKGFLYFPDTMLYYTDAGYLQSSWALHRWWLKNFHVAPLILSSVSFFTLMYIVRRFPIYVTLTFLHPYSLLLLFNATKEQLLFLFLISLTLLRKFFSPKWAMLIFALIAVSTVIEWRSVYALLFLVGGVALSVTPRSKMLVCLVGVLAISIISLSNPDQIYGAFEKLQSRAGISHVGREFFNGQCASERGSFVSLPACWFTLMIGMSFHPDMLHINGLILISFSVMYASTIILLIKYFNTKSVLVVAAYLACHLLIFWWGPTVGAYLRYAIPLSWFIAILYMINLAESRLIDSSRSIFLGSGGN